MNKQDLKIIIIIILGTIAVLTYPAILVLGNIKLEYQTKIDELCTEIEQLKQPIEIDEWELLKQAIILTESNGNPNAIGKEKDFGIFQITPIYVDEVNRLLGYNRFTHKDALDSLKSIEMFDIIQSYHNPTGCLKTALLKHNPNNTNKNYMTTYEYRVMYHFYRLKSECLRKR